MKNLKLFKLKIRTLSPVVVGFTPPSHYFYKTLNYLPSTTLRGAMATKILYEYCKKNREEFGKCRNCDEQENCEFFLFFYSNVFSLTDGFHRNILKEKDAGGFKPCNDSYIVPSHPLLQECKVCNSKENKPKTVYNKISEWKHSSYIKTACKEIGCKKKTTMKPIEKYFCKNCQRILKEPQIGLTTSTSIDRKRRSNIEGYLFRYSYLEADSIFESYLFTEESEIMKGFFRENNIFRIGRSKSRGFGKIKVDMEELDLNKKISETKEEIKKQLEDQVLILAAKSNIFNLEIDSNNNLGLLSNPLMNLNTAIKRIKNKLDLDIGNTEYNFKLNGTLGGLETISGWSYRTQQPKPHIEASTPGSLYKFGFEGVVSDGLLESLAYLEYGGISEYSHLGYNLVYYPSLKEVPVYE